MKNNSQNFAGILLAPLLTAALLLQSGLEKKSNFSKPTPNKLTTQAEVQWSREVFYIWKLADLYEMSGGHIQRRQQPAEKVHMNLMNGSKPTRDFQISTDIEFKNGTYFLPGSAQGPFLNELKIGDNYWRGFSKDKWERTHQVRVTPTFLPAAPSVTQALDVDTKAMPTSVAVQVQSDYAWHVLEVSESDDFKQSKLYWFTGLTAQLPAQSSDLFLRVQGVSNQQELSQPSPVYQVHVRASQSPAAPFVPPGPRLSSNL